MEPIERRTFLLTALAAAPLAACASGALPASAPPAPQRRTPVLVRAGQDRLGNPRTLFGHLEIDAKVATADTAGGVYIIEHSDQGKGGPPRHVHHAQDEWFYVLEGPYRVEVGDERFELVPGDFLLAPREIPHVWAHTGEGVGRLLIGFEPAGQIEAFFTALARAGDAPSVETLRRLTNAHGMTFVGPPLAV